MTPVARGLANAFAIEALVGMWIWLGWQLWKHLA